MRGSAVSASMASRSRCRNPASPSFSKMKGMSTPVRRSISASLSWKGRPSARARWRPTAVLPEPMGPMRNTLGLPSMQVREDTENDAAARRRPQPVSGTSGASVVDVYALAHDLRSNEDHELVLVVLVAGGLRDARARGYRPDT